MNSSCSKSSVTLQRSRLCGTFEQETDNGSTAFSRTGITNYTELPREFCLLLFIFALQQIINYIQNTSPYIVCVQETNGNWSKAPVIPNMLPCIHPNKVNLGMLLRKQLKRKSVASMHAGGKSFLGHIQNAA